MLEEETFASAKNQTLVIQSAVSHYTDRATPAPAPIARTQIKEVQELLINCSKVFIIYILKETVLKELIVYSCC
jgi:hypothetical protein